MKIAFVGAGSIAHEHKRALDVLGHELAGVCTRGESGLKFSQQYSVPYFRTAKEMVEKTEPDALFLLTHPRAYFEILQTIYLFNVPVLIEKPLPFPTCDAEELKSVLPEVAFVGLNRRFYGNTRAAIERVQGCRGFLAQLVLNERQKDYEKLAEHDRNNFHLYNDIHYLDLLFQLAGYPDYILSQQAWGKLPATRIAQYQITAFNTDRGNTCVLVANYNSAGGCRINLLLDQCEIIFSPIEKTSIKSLSGLEELEDSDADRAAKPGFVAQAECFLEGVRNPSSLPEEWVSYESALQSMKAIDILYENAFS